MIDWKNRNPKIKVIWSLGGWSYSNPFYDMVKTSATRKKFIDSVINWLRQPALFWVDGVDIDWEFPGGLGLDANQGDPSTDASHYLELMKELREALDVICEESGKHFELSNAIGVGPQ